MTSRFKTIWSQLSVRQQLTLTFALGIFCLAVLSSIVISSTTEQRLNRMLLEQGYNVVETLAEQSTVALLYQSEDAAAEAASPILSFPNVIGVSVLTPDNEMLFHEGEQTSMDGDSVQLANPRYAYREDDKAWYFSQPVYAGAGRQDSAFDLARPDEELVGFVRVSVGKSALQSMSASILRSNLITATFVAVLLVLVLMMITNRITRPLRALAEVMNRAQEGEDQVRATLSGSKDVVRMEQAFNAMMYELEAREEQLKRARDTALASARIKGQFATTVSHELRTPMNGVMGMLELLQSMDLTDEQREYVNVARSSGE